MKAKEIGFVIVFVILVCVVIKLSSKLQEMDQTIKQLSAQMDTATAHISAQLNAAATQINSAMQQAAQRKVPVIVTGFGADV
jgi:uncharacterized protein YoxC